MANISDYISTPQSAALDAVEVKTQYESNADTNALTDAGLVLVNGAVQPGDNVSTLTNDAGYTDDQTGAEIKVAYESELDTNAFTDAEQTKLAAFNQGLATTDSPEFVNLTVSNNFEVQGHISYDVATELTISAGGVITTTHSYHTVDTNADAATDDLVTITAQAAGTRLILQAANDARTVVCKDGGGNLRMAGDFSLDDNQSTIEFICNGAVWYELSRSNNN